LAGAECSWILDEVTDMPTDITPPQQPPKKKPKHQKPQLKVVFDTNALYVSPTSLGSASDLVREEIADLIAERKYPDLDILWYLPEVVRHERQFQMQAAALSLRPAIDKIERLLGHNLALTDEILLNHVEAKIDEKEKALELRELKLDQGKVDWSAVIRAASYRLPPFSPGEKEKGFRDAIVAESFLQLVADSPKTPNLCRVVLVTSDGLLSDAVNARISGHLNVSVLQGIEELKGLINALVSAVDQDFVGRLQPKARRLFFTSQGDKDALFYKADVRQRITEEFKGELAARPEGTTVRWDGTWRIGQPNFARKVGRRIFWASRIDIDAEAGNITTEPEQAPSFLDAGEGVNVAYQFSPAVGSPQQSTQGVTNSLWNRLFSTTTFLAPPGKKVVTHKGKDVYEVLWSTEVTLAKELRKAQIEETKHIAISWQPVS
jgi:hypothetical protein